MSYFFKIAKKGNAKGHSTGGGRGEEKSLPTEFYFIDHTLYDNRKTIN